MKTIISGLKAWHTVVAGIWAGCSTTELMFVAFISPSYTFFEKKNTPLDHICIKHTHTTHVTHSFLSNSLTDCYAH